MQQRPNSWDVAAEAGVSQSTVSRALRHDPAVTEATRERVLTAARRLRYVVNPNAAILRKGRSRTIGLTILFDAAVGLEALNPFYGDLQRQIVVAGSRRDLSVIVQYESAELHHSSFYDGAICEGYIVIGSARLEQSWQHFRELAAAGVPIAAWGIQSNALTALGSTNQEAAFDACNHLIELKRERIACLSPEPGARSQFSERIEGYELAMAKVGRKPNLIYADSLPNNPHQALQILSKGDNTGALPDALFVTQDALAISCMQALIQGGMRIPQDISICGFDGIEASNLIAPRLTTVRHDYRRIAERLVANVQARFLGLPVDTRPILPELDVRESTVAKEIGI